MTDTDPGTMKKEGTNKSKTDMTGIMTDGTPDGTTTDCHVTNMMGCRTTGKEDINI